jgi:hypothetical protein
MDAAVFWNSMRALRVRMGEGFGGAKGRQLLTVIQADDGAS